MPPSVKADAWEWVAQLAEQEYEELKARGELNEVMRHALKAVVPSLKRSAWRIRRNAKVRDGVSSGKE